MQPQQSESIDVDDLVPAGASDITKRVGQFRSRNASKGLERLEIYTSRLVKDQVKEFALVSRLTRGVAAEVLLQRGIAAHLSRTQDLSGIAQAADAPLPVVTDAPPIASSKPIPELARHFAERTHPNRQPQSDEQLLEPSFDVVSDSQMSTESTASEQMLPKLEPKDHPIARLIRRESGP